MPRPANNPIRTAFPGFQAALLAGVVVAFASPWATADEQPRLIDMEGAVNMAMARSGVVAAARADTAIFQAKLEQARWHQWPQINITSLLAPMVRQWGDALVGGTDLGQWGVFSHTEISGYVPLFTFGKIHYLKQAHELGVDVGLAQEAIARAEVRFQVQKGFFALSIARELADVVGEGRRYFDTATRHVDKLEKSDDPSFDPVDKLKIRVYEAQVMQKDLEAGRARTLALGNLRRVVGLDPQGTDDFRTPSPDPLVPRMDVSMQAAMDAAMENRPELVALRRGIAARNAEIRARYASFFPDFVLAGKFTYAYSDVATHQASPFANDPFNGYSAGGGLALKWDLDIGRKLGEWREAKAQAGRLAAQMDDAERAVRLEVEKLFLEMRDARTIVDAQQEALRAVRGWVLAKTDLYENGLSDLRDILDALVQFFLSRMTLLQAIHDYNVAVAALERATGLSLVPMIPGAAVIGPEE
jgi:outer membrane protein TolC